MSIHLVKVSAESGTSVIVRARTEPWSGLGGSIISTAAPAAAAVRLFGSSYTKRELMAILNEIDVPCGPIMSTEDLANDEHVRGREMYVELETRGRSISVIGPA